MVEPLTLAVGGLLATGGYLLGRRTRTTTSAPTSLCTCSHGYSIHDNGGPCTAEIEQPHYWKTGVREGYEWVPCPCKSYDGPDPLPRLWTP